MRHLITLASLLLALALAQPALAQGVMQDSYCTQISENDKYASDGYALTDAGSILRQDRANFHRFGIADDGDQADATFDSTKARQALPAMLDNGFIDDTTADQIVRGTPYVCVDIYRNALEVFIEDSGSAQIPDYETADYPFVGTWDCQVATMRFSSDVYDNGDERLPIEEIQEGSDGSYTLLFEDDYYITLADFTGDTMTWLSGASGDVFSCTRLDS